MAPMFIAKALDSNNFGNIDVTLKTKPLPSPSASMTVLAPDIAAVGLAVPPIERLRHMSANSWEDFAFEWAHSLKSKYARVEKHAGSGDMGLDIIAFESTIAAEPWDNFQCKHYDHPLSPGDIWIELGKLTYYTFIGEYSVPRSYQFIAPQGAGNSLSKLLRKPSELRDGLFTNWELHCRKKITSTCEIVLDITLRKHIEGFDFSIVSAASPLTILEEHRMTPWYVARFGGGLPERNDGSVPPFEVMANEITYVRALLDAYEDRLGTAMALPEQIIEGELVSHFDRSRREFYSAESLRAFSRDNVPPGTFDKLLDEVHDGVADVEQSNHKDGYARVLAVVKQAKALQITANALISRTHMSDRGGMCHQLANDNRLRWRR